ncbi:alpha/beta hydrolase [Roseibium polysiphoniae]|uniref:alpha/beta hydrolase n=1 Tax=Roseibium polysiphoniae TaxID=2571221 RepID=UPI0032972DB4
MTLIDHPDNPIPEGCNSGSMRTSDGVALRYAHWPATGGPRRGTVTLLQGRAEFIEKYFEVIKDLRQRGFAVIAFDWRGQGGSERLLRNRCKGHIGNMKQFREDLHTILQKVSLAEYPGPHFALAHSTGGAVLLSDALRLRTMLDRVVLSSPLTGMLDNGWKERWSFRVAAAFKWVGLGRLYIPGGNGDLFVDFEENRQTQDRTRFERFNAVLRQAPELGLGSPTIGWLYAVSRAILSLRKREYGPSVSLPCLVVAAGKDRIVSTPATEELVSRMKSAGYLEIAGAEHELLMERDAIRDQFWAAFDAFIPGQAG